MRLHRWRGFCGGEIVDRDEQVGEVLHHRSVPELREVVRGFPDQVENGASLLEAGRGTGGEDDQRRVGGLVPGTADRGIHELSADRAERGSGAQFCRQGKGSHLDNNETRVGTGGEIRGDLIECLDTRQPQKHDLRLGGDRLRRRLGRSPICSRADTRAASMSKPRTVCPAASRCPATAEPITPRRRFRRSYCSPPRIRTSRWVSRDSRAAPDTGTGRRHRGRRDRLLSTSRKRGSPCRAEESGRRLLRRKP